MVNIIKSDFYTQLKQFKVYAYTMIFALIYILSATLGNVWEYTGNMTVTQLMNLVLKQQFMIFFMISIGVTSYYIGKMFSNKFINLQVINCKERQRVLFAKYIVQSTINVIIISLILAGALVALNFVYNVNYMNISGMILRWGLLVVLIIRFTIMIVSAVFIMKNGVVAALIGWIIFVVQSIPFLIGAEYNSNFLLKASKLFVTGQIYEICSKDIITGTEMIWILFTSVVESAVWIILTHRNFKKAELM